jgi:hypothetical protein
MIKQLTRECDNLATRFWRQEASGRGRGYLEWLQKVRQTADIIEKNRLQSCYFSSNCLESANTNAFKRVVRSKSNKSNTKVTKKIDLNP